MSPEHSGTAISGVCAMHPLVRIFNIVWFGGVALIGGTVLIATGWNALSSKSAESRDTLLGMVIPLGMLAFGIGLVRFGRYLARNDPRFFTDFLIQTLDARPEAARASLHL
jgi:hypothetical protein